MSELKTRIEAKKKRLEADLLGLKADAQAKANEARARVKAKLSELEDILEKGWDSMSDGVRDKLNKWLS